MEIDKDLMILNQLTNEELDPLVDIIINKGGISEFLSVNEKYKKYAPNHKMYLDVIKDELSRFGGNSFANFFRGHGISYREMLTDVCDKLKVSYNKKSKIERIESCLLQKILIDSWENLTEEQKREVLKSTGNPSLFRGEMVPAAALGALSIGGFSAFLTAKIIALNILQQNLVSRGAVLGAKMASMKWAGATAARQTAINAASKSTMALSGIKLLTGPIGWTITGLWTANDIASTAFRVTIPAVIYISAMRCIYINKMKNENNLLIEENYPADDNTNGILKYCNIKLGLDSVSKEEAIKMAGTLLYESGYVEKEYIESMLIRERDVSTFMGRGIAIPHGENMAKDSVKKSGIVVLQFPNGVDFGNGTAYLVIGIAGKDDEHLAILANIAIALDEYTDEQMVEFFCTMDKKVLYTLFTEKND